MTQDTPSPPPDDGREEDRKPAPPSHARSGQDPTTAPPSEAPAEQFYARENRKD